MLNEMCCHAGMHSWGGLVRTLGDMDAALACKMISHEMPSLRLKPGLIRMTIL